MAARYHIDVRDRWRRDENGVRLLTLRMLAVRVRHLPPDSAVARLQADHAPWLTADYLLADVYGVLAGQPHPARPKSGPAGTDPTRERKRASALMRARRRQQQIQDGEIT